MKLNLRGEIEAAHKDTRILCQRRCGAETEAARRDAPASFVTAGRTETLLVQLVRHAVLIAAGAKNALLTVEDQGDVGRSLLRIDTLAHASDTEHEAQPLAVAAIGPGNANAQSGPVGTRTTVAEHLGIVPGEIQIDRSAQPCAQLTAAFGDAGGRRASSRAGCDCASRKRGRGGRVEGHQSAQQRS